MQRRDAATMQEALLPISFLYQAGPKDPQLFIYIPLQCLLVQNVAI